MFDDAYLTKIYRYAAPGYLDIATYLTLCQVGSQEFYIQMSQDEDKPQWHLYDGDEVQAVSFIRSIINKPG